VPVSGRSVAPLALMLVLAVPLGAQQHPEGPTPPGARWAVHSWSRPRPPVVDPGPERPPQPPPSDATVLFAGHGLGEWLARDSTSAKWAVREDYLECVPGTGSLISRRGFGDLQLHLEFATPDPPHGESQERGNSGVYLMGTYEIQVLDSYRNDTYPDGQAAAVYGQTPPLVNASRGPGRWQTYDIVFHRPHFNADGSVQAPARVTVFHNGVLVQDNTTITGATVHMAIAQYAAHADRMPIVLQDHGNRIRYRNVWVRELEGS
jgi:hypothetical protein